MKLNCSICAYLVNGEVKANTIINGQAVCYEHMGFVGGGDHSRAIHTAKAAMDAKTTAHNGMEGLVDE